jgi:hypothetical protein
MRRIVLLLGLWLVSFGANAAEVRAWLDRDSAHLGETVTLNVEASGVGNDTPDFSALSADFDQLGTSSSSSVNIVNGSTTAKQLWAVGLAPKHEGRIVVPPIAVGGVRSQPLSLTVLPAPVGASGHAGDDAFVEVSAEPESPYVQQQVRLTVALYFAVNLAEGNLDDPHVDGAVVQKLEDRNYQAQRDGRTYRVIERHYALSAEKSGNLDIPALNFRGRAVGNDPTAAFFGRGQAIGARSQALSLTVRPRPAAAPPGPWLPAQSLTYRVEGGDAAARVGEPITLTASLQAQGLGFEQLPELGLPKLEGAEMYPDKPTTRTRDDGTWLFGEAERKFAIVATRPGTLHLPEQRLSWWNTAKDAPETIVIPARDIDVQAAAGGGAAPAAASPPTVSAGTPSSAARTDGALPSSLASTQSLAWRMVALGLLVLWLATLAAWFWSARRTAPSGPASMPAAPAAAPSARAAKAAFERAVAAADASAIARTLLAWAAAEGHGVAHLGALAAQLDDAAQRNALRALERARFGDGAAPDAAVLRKTFAGGLRWLRETPHPREGSPLPPLYP